MCSYSCLCAYLCSVNYVCTFQSVTNEPSTLTVNFILVSACSSCSGCSGHSSILGFPHTPYILYSTVHTTCAQQKPAGWISVNSYLDKNNDYHILVCACISMYVCMYRSLTKEWLLTNECLPSTFGPIFCIGSNFTWLSAHHGTGFVWSLRSTLASFPGLRTV